jgi:hypothetical protein
MVLSLVAQTVEKPQFSLKSRAPAQGELRFQLEERMGIAGFVQKGEVEVAFPVVRGGHPYELEVVDVVSGPSELTQWIKGRYRGVELCFFDPLHSLGLARYRRGETHSFVLNALALSLKRVQAYSLPDEWDGELPFATSGFRTLLPCKGDSPDEFVFQSPIEGAPRTILFRDRNFRLLPISLAEWEGEQMQVDLYVAPELAETLEPSPDSGDEIAGLLWLQGYSPEHFQPGK